MNKYAAYVQLDTKNKNVKNSNLAELNFVPVPFQEKALAESWLLANFGSVSKEIIIFDQFGECSVVK